MSSHGPYDATMHNSLVSWNVSASMRGSYSASVKFTNQERQFSEDMFLWKPLAVHIDVDNTVTTELISHELLGTTPQTDKRILGIVSAFSDGQSIPDHEVDLSIDSFASRLAFKPSVSPELTTVSEALTYLATVIAGVPSELLDIGEAPLSLDGLYAMGANVLDDMRQIAQAGGMSLYVNTSGILVAAPWKDHNSPVDHVIPTSVVIHAERSMKISTGPSRYKVRGAWEGTRIFGRPEQLSMNDGSDPYSSEATRGKVVYCIETGVPKPSITLMIPEVSKKAKKDVQITVEPLSGDIEEYVRPSDGPDNSSGEHKKGGIVLVPSAGEDTYVYPGLHEVKLGAKAYDDYESENTDPMILTKTLRKDYKTKDNKDKQVLKKFKAGPGRGPGFGGGGPSGAAYGPAMNRGPDEFGENQLEITIQDRDLVAEFGVLEDEINNIYIPSRDQAVNIAIRAFQEWKMMRKTWDFKITYMAELELNDKITITALDGTEVTGLLTGIVIDFANTPTAMMDLTVESMEDIGSTTYDTSDAGIDGNLLGDPVPNTDESSYWFYSNPDTVYGREGYVHIGVGGFIGRVEQLTIGDEYTLTVSGFNVDGEFNTIPGTSITLTPLGLSNSITVESVAGVGILTNLLLHKTKMG